MFVSSLNIVPIKKAYISNIYQHTQLQCLVLKGANIGPTLGTTMTTMLVLRDVSKRRACSY